LQVAPSVMTKQLMRDLLISSAGVGTISAAFFYSYASLQIPAGMLYDRYGPRLLLTFATLICGIGAILFSTGHSMELLSWARVLIGAGAAFSFIGCLVLIANWLPAGYFALSAAIVQAMSSVGAICGQVPLSAAVRHFTWQTSILWMGFFGILLSTLIAFFVRDRAPWYPKKETLSRAPKKKQSLRNLTNVLSDFQTWMIGLYSFCIWMPTLIFASLWGVPFLAEKYAMTTIEASAFTSMIWLGIAFGGPMLAWYSNRTQKRKAPLILGAALGIIGIITITYLPVPKWLGLIALLLIGVSSSAQSFAFAVVKDINTPKTMGTAAGINNMFVVAGGALFQPLVGYLLHFFWNGEMLHQVPYYSIAAYQKSLILLPITAFMCLIVGVFLIKETNCQPTHPA
ncbi:MAG: MFS transporter, partial [Pseudomonadota bacterium]